MESKTIVVLANSWKKGGRCLAGKVVELHDDKITGFGPWVRPISAGTVEHTGKSEGGQVTEQTMQKCLNRRKLPSILEILEIPLSRFIGTPDQPENWEVADGQPWQQPRLLQSRTFGSNR